MPRASRHIIANLVPPHRKIFICIKTGTWKTSLEEESRKTLPDGQVDRPEPLLHPKKGCLFGKSRASDFVRRNPRNTLLTKALNYYLELNFCKQCIYQQYSWICDTCRLNKLLIVSTLWNCFSESPWEGSDRQMLSLISGYILNPLDINHWPILGLGVYPAAPRLLSEKKFRKQEYSLWTAWLNGRVFPLTLIKSLETL